MNCMSEGWVYVDGYALLLGMSGGGACIETGREDSDSDPTSSVCSIFHPRFWAEFAPNTYLEQPTLGYTCTEVQRDYTASPAGNKCTSLPLNLSLTTHDIPPKVYDIWTPNDSTQSPPQYPSGLQYGHHLHRPRRRHHPPPPPRPHPPPSPTLPRRHHRRAGRVLHHR